MILAAPFKPFLEHISLICCNVNDWPSAPVSVWCLRDCLEGRFSSPIALRKPIAFDERNFNALTVDPAEHRVQVLMCGQPCDEIVGCIHANPP
jgi:hypothetical protein